MVCRCLLLMVFVLVVFHMFNYYCVACLSLVAVGCRCMLLLYVVCCVRCLLLVVCSLH